MEKITFAVTDGAMVTTSNLETFPMMAQAGALPAALLCEACMRRGIRQLWFVPAPAFTLDDTLGWDFREDEEKGPSAWIHSFKHGTNAEVDLVRPSLDRDNPFQQAEDDTTLLAALIRFRELVGVDFRYSAQATSRGLLIGLHQGHKNNVPLRVVPMPPPALDPRTETPLEWVLPAEAVRALPAFRYVHAYDKNASFLGAASNLPVGAGRFDHVTGVTDKDTGLPGYFRIADQVTMFPNSIPALPPVRSIPTDDNTRWVTTPTLMYLKELGGCLPPILDAYIWREHHQPLQPWYQRLRDARTQLQESRHLPQSQLALAAVKACYASLLGGYLGAPSSDKWDRTGDVLYRPDVRHMVIAKARNTLHRTARRSQDDGAVVLALSGTDTMYILSNDPDPVASKPARLNLGVEQVCYKVKGSWELTPDLRAMLEKESLSSIATVKVFTEGPANVRA